MHVYNTKDFKQNGQWIATYRQDGMCFHTLSFCYWSRLQQRCKKGVTQRNSPTYTECSNGFKDYQDFAGWCQEQMGYGNKENSGKFWHLDKDILVKGNKVYSRNTCCFVPKYLNTLLQKREAMRGEYPIGVYKDGDYYVGRLGRLLLYDDSLRKRFKSPEQAFLFYKEQKEKYIKEVADFYRDQVDPRVYEALYKYEVDIDD